MDKRYDDIINLPHHVSTKRKHMTMYERAAQFSPFAALTGYDYIVTETGRITYAKAELDETEKDIINRRLAELNERIQEHPQVMVTYYIPDETKQGGRYVTVTDKVVKLKTYEKILVLENGEEIIFEDIMDIEI